MLFKKHGYPEEGEVVICTVTKVYPNSVFVNMDEYSKSGMINIAEISAGRIRNIRDFVAEKKVVYCKVLRVNQERNHIDLSLRRVSESMRRAKSEQLKKEQLAEKIIEIVAKSQKKDFKRLYDEIAPKIFEDYEYIHGLFEDVSKDEEKISDYVKDKIVADAIEELIRQRLKPQEIKVEGVFTITIYASDCVSVIKNAFAPIQNDDKMAVHYLGGGRYKIEVFDIDYKNAEKDLKAETDRIEKIIKENKGAVSFEKVEKD